MLLQTYMHRLPLATKFHHEFAEYHTPISMAASEQTGAFLWALLDILKPNFVFETGSGYTTVILSEWLREHLDSQDTDAKRDTLRLYHVEDSQDWQQKVLEHLNRVDAQPGKFINYGELYEINLEEPFFALLDGVLTQRPVVVHWLKNAARMGVLLIDDAQEGTFSEVLESIDILAESGQGILYDTGVSPKAGKELEIGSHDL